MAATAIRQLTSDVREKLGKLLPLLSSSHAGEQAGAAAAIKRVLEAAGLDIHDLTGAILSAPAAATAPPPRRSTRSDDEQDTTFTSHEIVELVEALRSRRQFNASSEEFLDSLLGRAKRYDAVFVSLKMRRWIVDLMRQAGLDPDA